MTRITLGAVAALWRYPISSLGGERLTSARLTSSGVVGDRTHALVDQTEARPVDPARRQWQGAAQLMARQSGGAPELSFDGETWGGAEALGAKLEGHFGQPVTLRAYGAEVRHRYGLAPVHLLSLQALALLRQALPAAQIDERRFRPNLVVDLPLARGEGLPEWQLVGQEFRIGALRLRGLSRTARCSFTTLAQPGLPEDPAVLRELLAVLGRDFGIYCEVLDMGTVSVGDRLTQEVPPARRVVILGAGLAGATAAKALRAGGFAGEITLAGSEPLPPYDRPALSKSLADGAPASLMTREEAKASRIAMRLGLEALEIDRMARSVRFRGGEVMDYDRLILATGGVARRIAGLEGMRVHHLRSAADGARLREALSEAARVLVLGGGWLGLEAAAAARGLGKEVTLFARGGIGARVLPRAVAQEVAAWHRAAGVRLVEEVPALTETPQGIAASWGDETAEADLVVVAIDMVPEDHLARGAGLATSDGVLTDAEGRTSDPCIFAVGDVARPNEGALQSWQGAEVQATKAARALLGLEPPPHEPPRFWSTQYGHLLQIAGRPDPTAAPLSQEPGLWHFDGFVIALDRPLPLPQSAARAEADIDLTGRQPLSLGPLDLSEGEILRVQAGGLDLVVTRVGARFHAIETACPHVGASLAEGRVEGHHILCPLHFAAFDLRDGHPHQAPAGCKSARVWPVTINEGQATLWVEGTSLTGMNPSSG